jgi:putative aldouronate transport system substrate-binding protein
MHVFIPVKNLVSPDPNFSAVPVPPPVRTPGQTVHLGQLNPLTEWIMIITDQNPDPVLWTRLMNYLYSPEGTILANWGVYGIHHEINPNDGLPQFTAFMYDNPDWNLHQVQRRYTRMPSGGWAYNHQREDRVPGDGPILINAAQVWSQNVDFAWQLPPITRTASEGSEYTRIMADANTFRDEMVARFITGAESLDNWDSFISTLRAMDIDRAIEIQQAALHRFNAR